MSYIYGGNTNLTPEQARRRRSIANAMMKTGAAQEQPQNVGEGLEYASGQLLDALQSRKAMEAAGSNAVSGGGLNMATYAPAAGKLGKKLFGGLF